ncbi:MAG: M23 family metallopeptidase, partial [Myxococcales bacterium]|nr:M23 family metallopeptidase [Myxococcales bacterium]
MAGALGWRSYRRSTSGGKGTFPVPGASFATWIDPLPSLDARVAVVSNPFRGPESTEQAARQHLGVDLMFRRSDARDLVAAFPPGTPGGTAQFFMPEQIPALAASAGVVTFAADTPVGKTVIVRHPNGWATYYTHLSALAVHAQSTVRAGDTVGTVGASPTDPAHLRHLHFELWKGANRSGAVDPSPYLDAWSRKSLAWSPTVVASTTP